MTASRANRTKTRVFACLALAASLCLGGCRRSHNPNSNSIGGQNPAAPADSDEAKRQAQTLIEEGKELYRNDQDEQAVEKFKQAVDRDPNNAEAHLRLGMSYGALEKKDEAESEYKKSVELFKKKAQAESKDSDTYFYLGEAHSFLHQDDDAVRAYRQATKLKPEDEEAWYRLGMAETRLAQYPEATSAFQKALDLDPNDTRAADGLENAQQGSQRIKEGKKHAEDMLKKQANANANLNSNNNAGSKPTPKRPPMVKY
jgi:Flp pilus assembly protein TadD